MSTAPRGYLDGLRGGQLHGWAWDPGHPDARLVIDVYEGNQLVLSSVADWFRADLMDCKMGDGAHSFRIDLPPEWLERDLTLSVRCRDPQFELEQSPIKRRKPVYDENGMRFESILLVDSNNILNLVLGEGPYRVNELLIDPIDLCNADCLYCHHTRTGKKLDLDLFQRFLEEKVVRADRLQFGCGQEPTTHLGLIEYFERVAKLPYKPGVIEMITNGTLLDRHDARRMQDLGLKVLKLSIDSADPEIQNKLRPGTDLRRILKNLEGFRARAPEVEFEFSSVISSGNIKAAKELVDLANQLGVRWIHFREVTRFETQYTRTPGFYERLESLTLDAGEFNAAVAELREAHPEGRFGFMSVEDQLGRRPQRGAGAPRLS